MSATIRAALAAKRAEAAKAKSSRPASPEKHDELSGFAQMPLEKLLLRACQNGKLNLSARVPALVALPEEIFVIIGGAQPHWYERGDQDRAWYEREEVRTLQASGNALGQLDERIGDFRALLKVELQQNELATVPESFLHLEHLTVLNLADNKLTAFPTCILALDNLKTLDLSSNQIKSLWTADQVLASRSEKKKRRTEWERENGPIHEDGMWTTFLSGPSSPVKKSAKSLLPQAVLPPTTPMHALRTLRLGKNRLGNAAFEASDAFSYPPRLRTLDLSDNDIRGPVSLAMLADLSELQELDLSANGISDQVFDAKTAAKGTFGSLGLLHLARCDICDLGPLQAIFGSGPILEQNSDNKADAGVPNPPTQATTLARKQLIRLRGSPSIAEADGELHVILEGNPLDEIKRKRAAVRAGANANAPMRGRQSSGFEPIAGDFGSPGTPIVNDGGPFKARSPGSDQQAVSHGAEPVSALAMQAQMQQMRVDSSSRPHAAAPQKEEWELLAEAGLLTEGGKRKARAEQARREREAQAKSSGSANTQRSQQGNGDNSFFDGQADAGSSLANAKLSTKKKEALSQVPCKFFRSAGCSAGASCPFSHAKPNEGPQQKATCQWFLKGNCRFGRKCALRHALPSDPPGMDRKNKRAAQQGMQSEQQRREMDGNQYPQPYAPPFGVDPSFMVPAPGMWPPPHEQNAATNDLMFGMPDDLRGPPSAQGMPAPVPSTSPSVHRGSLRFAADQSILSASPGSRAFGTSPFSQGGHVFFSGSQGSDADYAAHGQRELDARRPQDEDDDQFETELLPSSLSELLTPEELIRRDRANRPAYSLPAASVLDDASQVPPQVRRSGASETAARLGLYSVSPSSSLPRSSGLMARTGGGYAQAVSGSPSSLTANPLPPHAYSPASRAALGAHAPGSSLPRGLAAGLSRIHLKQPSEELLPPHAPQQVSSNGRSSQLDDLTPIAPSSVLPHRQTFGLDGNFAQRGSTASSPRSWGAQRGDLPGMPIPPAGVNGAQAGIQVSQGSPSKSAVGRIRGSAPLAGSPLAMSGGGRREDDEDAIFQFE